MDGDRECYLLLFLLVLVLVLGLGLGFQAGWSGNQRNWECAFFLLVGSGLRLGWESTLKGSRRLKDRDG